MPGRFPASFPGAWSILPSHKVIAGAWSFWSRPPLSPGRRLCTCARSHTEAVWGFRCRRMLHIAHGQPPGPGGEVGAGAAGLNRVNLGVRYYLLSRIWGRGGPTSWGSHLSQSWARYSACQPAGRSCTGTLPCSWAAPPRTRSHHATGPRNITRHIRQKVRGTCQTRTMWECQGEIKENYKEGETGFSTNLKFKLIRAKYWAYIIQKVTADKGNMHT